jgi:caa(3)-type oxidase subunit IV
MSKHEEIGHAIPKSTVIGSYFALLILAAVMVGLSRLNVERLGIEWVDLHAVKSSIIMGVALIMGLIVSMFLMGLRYESKLLNLTIFLSNFVFLLIFVLFTWVDTSFRGEVDPTFNEKINFVSPVKAEAAGSHGGATHETAPAAGHEAAPAAGHDSASAAPASAAPASAAPASAAPASAAPAAGHEAAPAAVAPAATPAPAAGHEAAPAAKKEAAPAH